MVRLGVVAAVVAALLVCASTASGAVNICVPTDGRAGGDVGRQPAGVARRALTGWMPSSTAEQQRLIDILPYLEFSSSGVGTKPTIRVKGANLQVISGTGATGRRGQRDRQPGRRVRRGIRDARPARTTRSSGRTRLRRASAR